MGPVRRWANYAAVMSTPEVVEGALRDDAVTVSGVRLALRRAGGDRRPVLLVHGLASNARMWDGVAARLAAAGHEVAAVDLRGHGRSEQVGEGYDTPTAAADLARLLDAFGWTDARAPIVAGQSWGGNVVLELAATWRRPAAVALVDGGWLRLRDRFSNFDECWRALRPPRFDGTTESELDARLRSWTLGWPPGSAAGVKGNFEVLADGTVRARLSLEHHREIVRSLWDRDPRLLYPRIAVPVLLLVAVGDGSDDAKRVAVEEARSALPDAEVREYAGAHHDLHTQHPDRTAADLLWLAARLERRDDGGRGLGRP